MQICQVGVFCDHKSAIVYFELVSNALNFLTHCTIKPSPDYLTSTPRGDRTDLKIDQIANNIIDIYKDDQYKDYSLFISGHR